MRFKHLYNIVLAAHEVGKQLDGANEGDFYAKLKSILDDAPKRTKLRSALDRLNQSVRSLEDQQIIISNKEV